MPSPIAPQTMAELRQRQPAARAANDKAAIDKNPKVGPNGAFQRAAPPPRRSDRSLHIAFALMILMFFVMYAKWNEGSPTSYSVSGKKLPQWYALCGSDGRPIYTLPVEGGEGKVECVVVNGKYVADTGSLGE